MVGLGYKPDGVASNCRYGYAAGCEAVAKPRPLVPIILRAVPLVWALPVRDGSSYQVLGELFGCGNTSDK